MDPFMAMIASIFGMGGGGGGAPGGGTPVPAGGGSAPVPQFGSMQAPQQPGGDGVDPQTKLAMNAMASAQGGNQSNLLANLQQMPGFDPSRLRQIIGQRMKLGV